MFKSEKQVWLILVQDEAAQESSILDSGNRSGYTTDRFSDRFLDVSGSGVDRDDSGSNVTWRQSDDFGEQSYKIIFALISVSSKDDVNVFNHLYQSKTRTRLVWLNLEWFIFVISQFVTEQCLVHLEDKTNNHDGQKFKSQ